MKITSDLTNLTTAILILTVQMFIEWTLWFLHICSRKLATTPTFFFEWKYMPSDTSFESSLPEYLNRLFPTEN
jgi:hypothetical protein